jgi:hypothetical protein
MVTSSPPLPIREGLGTERMLAPGESEAFVFRVDRAGPIGVGVAADRAGVQARLIGPAGDVLGQGAAIWRDLEAGDYVLLVGAPETGAPARIRTALVGTVPPGDGPPREEIERFLALAGAAPVAARGVVGVEDRPGPESSPPDGEENEEEEELEMTSRVAAAEDER